jgi:hypothetical protein
MPDVTDRVALARDDVAKLWLTFDGLQAGATAQVQVGDSQWQGVDFSEDRPFVLVQGPDAEDPEALVIPDSGPIRVRFVSLPEHRTVSAGYLTLVTRG